MSKQFLQHVGRILNCGPGKPGPCSKGQRGKEASQAAHDATKKAFKDGTKSSHEEAAKAHSSLAFHPDIGQSARGNHIAQAEKHTKIAKRLK